ncbi:MAG TPA: Na+/H+ antiporter, partial [Rhodopila sp.]
MSAVAHYEFFLLLLVAILVLELLARRLRLPPAAAFILGGIALALLPGVPDVRIDPDLVLVVFLPPLLMSGAYFTVWREFRQNLSGILLLAVGATIFTTFVVGVTVHWLVPGLPWAVCFALGAIVSPPDAVAADAVLERLSLPGRITALLQGESLLNDAAGLVLFRFAVAAALTGTFSVTTALSSFCIVSLGGIVIGLVTGKCGLFVIRRLQDSDLAITATLLLAGLSYIGADRLHVSGVLATVTTGLMLGWHQHSDFTAGTRLRAQAFWKVLVFLLQSVLFILIGLSLRGVLARLENRQDTVDSLLLPAIAIVVVVIVSRFVWLFGSDAVRRLVRLLRGPSGPEPSLVVATIMSWAGMRGVVTLAAALSLPDDMAGRDLVLTCAFVVILVTVLLHGTMLGPLIRLLRISGANELEVLQ